MIDPDREAMSEWDKLEAAPEDDDSPEAHEFFLKWVREQTKDLPKLQPDQAS